MIHFLAYIDPGTGSLIFQMLIAGVMSLMFFFRRFFIIPFKAFINLFRKEKEELDE